MFSITSRVQSDTNLISSFTINIKHFTSKYFLDKNREYSFIDTAADDCLSLLWYSHASTCILSTWSTGVYFSFCWKHFQDFIEFCFFFHENFHPKKHVFRGKLTNYEWFSFKFFKIFHFFPWRKILRFKSWEKYTPVVSTSVNVSPGNTLFTTQSHRWDQKHINRHKNWSRVETFENF